MWAVPDTDKARLLIDAGADVNAVSADGRTPLLIAAGFRGSAPVIRLLLEKGANIRARAPGLFGETTALLQSAALMQGAIMNYVNDSAPLHLCSAMNAPTTAIFCSTTPAFGFGPLADNGRVVESREILTCKPCSLHGRPACPLTHFRCAYDIEISEVIRGTQ